MTSRRQFVRAVGLALGGPLVGARVASADSAPTGSAREPDAPTELAVRGSPRLLEVTGLPDAVAPRVEATTAWYRSVSLSDIEFVSATLRAAGDRIYDGTGTAYGSFDAAAVARELAANTEFVRLDSQSRPSRNRQRISRTTVNRAETARRQRDSETEVLLRSEPASTVILDDRRVDVAHGVSPEDATDRLAETRRQSASAVPDGRGAPQLASVLEGDVVAHASLGERARQVVRIELPETAETVATVVRGTQAVGIGAQVSSEVITVRYALQYDGAERIKRAVDSLIAELAADQHVEVIERYPQDRAMVVDISMTATEIWSIHEQLLDT
ncbi:hypothetical protein [Halovenus sp. HT40]|uniref:hypothetical protein n=1 Tax=Halovenus sp. HT40 TaxID=3126691 RepID=UPI00300F0BBC